ncbi:Putative nuclease [Frankliniella fusca]|uniref:Nuclease n=1 Tax=Frankliniella fusca TaxID=407009 RepID=A0AAE1I267_9NEOP|nr:Putative nuclease [Frankliniella fusca]
MLAAWPFLNSRLGLPGVLGQLDGTLKPIFPPQKPNQHYYNRKWFTSSNVMIVCDANLKILTLDARYPGS